MKLLWFLPSVVLIAVPADVVAANDESANPLMIRGSIAGQDRLLSKNVAFCRKVGIDTFATVKMPRSEGEGKGLVKGKCGNICARICEHQPCMTDFVASTDTCKCLDSVSTVEKQCQANAVCDLDHDKCVCMKGFKKDRDTCIAKEICKAAEIKRCSTNAVCTPKSQFYRTDIRCTCNPGFTGDGFTCTDVNECTDGSNPCPQTSTCTNTLGSYTCSGGSGPGSDGDVDECSSANLNKCSPNAICNNQPGTYQCVCKTGFAGDGFTCSDIDECAERYGICGVNSVCKNTEGWFTCTCLAGFSLIGNECRDIDECLPGGNNTCSKDAKCFNSPGSYTCVCKDGYSGDGRSCTDINECTNGSNPCPLNSTCTNKPGSYNCSHASGPGSGEDVDECSSPNLNKCSPYAICDNQPGTYQCFCKPGFVGDGFTCVDVDECAQGSSTCGVNGVCENTAGSFICTCDPGFALIGNECRDIDECLPSGNNTCSKDAVCTNSPGSYTCVCKDGFSGDGRNCTDINECNNGSNPCPQNSTCTNKSGSYECTCNLGYSGDGRVCEDIDECSLSFLNKCSPFATCRNQPGSYECDCKVGFVGNGLICDDFDECAQGSNICSVNGVCENSLGSFTCTCNPGFLYVGNNCYDIDECLPGGNNTCSKDATCINSPGSYTCVCGDGFSGDGRSCTDINECTNGSNPCPLNSTCTNKPGSYNCSHASGPGSGEDVDECSSPNLNRCSPYAICDNQPGTYQCFCKPGFVGDGFTCVDVDECAQGSSTCGVNGVCENTVGSFICTCDPGFALDGIECRDIDECLPGAINTCNKDATCLNSPGSYKCACLDGFSGDGTTCTDINECTAGSNPCPQNATCTNIPGSYNCSCSSGFEFDGSNKCVDIDECRLASECNPSTRVCINTVGSFKCMCPEGFAYNSEGTDCIDINECESPPGPAHPCYLPSSQTVFACVNLVGSFRCQCTSGFEQSANGKTCSDINECALGYCGNLTATKTCVNLDGEYKCLHVDPNPSTPTYFKLVPNIATTEITAVMNWIKAKTVETVIPFCWKESYGRGVGTIPSAGCDPVYQEQIGLLCYDKCPVGYARFGFDCHSSCPPNFLDQGLLCRLPEYGRGGGFLWEFGDAPFDISGAVRRCDKALGGEGSCEAWGLVAYPKCKEGYHNFLCCLCTAYLSCGDYGLNDWILPSCAKKIIIGNPSGQRCTPKIVPNIITIFTSDGEVFYLEDVVQQNSHPVLEYDAGLCYPPCKSGFYGAGPLCFQACNADQTDCAAACASSPGACAFAIVDMWVEAAIVAINIATFGLAAPLTKMATIAMKVGNSVQMVAGSTRIAKALVSLVNVMKDATPVPVANGFNVFKRVLDEKRDSISVVEEVYHYSTLVYEAQEEFRSAFADDFAGHTSPAVNDEINRRFTPLVADFLKRQWADVELVMMAEVNGWRTASLVLNFAAIADPTGIVGLVAAFAKPPCKTVPPFPCISAALTC